jgi:hypothetical protein
MAGLRMQTGLCVDRMQDSTFIRNHPGNERHDLAQPQIYYLSTHVHVCGLEDGAIILDVKSGSYLGIDAEYLPDLIARIGNWPDSNRSERASERPESMKCDRLLNDLLQRGIVTKDVSLPRSALVQKCSSALTITDNSPARRKVSPRQAVEFLIALLVVTLRHRRKLAQLLEWLRRRQYAIHRDQPQATMDMGAMERLTSFMKLRIWCYTASRRCLFDSLVLSVYMTRAAIPCTLVVGVITKPFRAHAWVQIEDLVLNDTAEHVQQFNPILAVGECEY